MHRELLRIARDLIDDGGRGRILQARRARATSSAYYALFHRLSAFCAAGIIGWPRSKTDEFELVYRSLDHGRTRSVFTELAKPTAKSDALRSIGQIFINLQKQRHNADYGFIYKVSKNEVFDLIDQAEQAIDTIDAIDGRPNDAERLTLLARLVSGRARVS